jgi:TolA-binding protein
MNEIEKENLQYQHKQEKFDREELKRLDKIDADENHSSHIHSSNQNDQRRINNMEHKESDFTVQQATFDRKENVNVLDNRNKMMNYQHKQDHFDVAIN